jgi:hypothetical protein
LSEARGTQVVLLRFGRAFVFEDSLRLIEPLIDFRRGDGVKLGLDPYPLRFTINDRGRFGNV